jgi:hypothetical protein
MRLLLILLFAPLAFAEPLNEKYSYKAFPTHGLSFKGVDATEFNGTEIIGACFFQEWVEGDAEVIKDIFPNGMTGVIFTKCNLDNISIPVGNTVVGGTEKGIKVQNDLDDWTIDKGDKKALEPLNKEERVKAGVSIDPKDIPKTKLTKEEKEDFDKIIEDGQ